MKLIFSLFFLSLTATLLSQTKESLHARINWLTSTHHEPFQFNNKGQEELPTTDNFCEKDENSKYWHFQDLNHDGLLDAIYSGPCNPYHYTIIFLNRGDEFEKVFERTGEITYLNTTNETTKIGVLKEACCCDLFSTFIEITFDSTNHIDESDLYYHFLTKISTSKEWKTRFFSGTLRDTPEINDSPFEDDCSGEKRKGNHITEIEGKKAPQVLIIDSINGWDLIVYKDGPGLLIMGWVEKE